MKILLGTYTRNTSEGIYQIELNEETEQLENLQLVGNAQNPTYLDYDHDENKVYSVFQENDQGGVAVFKRDEDDLLELDHHFLTKGNPPCYVKYDKNSELIFDANYHMGTMNVYNDRGLFAQVEYEDGAHAHFADFDPKTGKLYVCDLGNDRIHQYSNNKESNRLNLEDNTGPRHIAFHPGLNRLYVFGELNNTITVLDDSLKKYQTISTLKNKDTESSGAAIKISNDGKYLYASNRGEDSIVIYEIKADGTLNTLDSISTFGEHPRDFSLSPDNNYLVVANRDTNNLTLYKRAKETGLLEVIQKDVHAPEAVCVLFIED